MSSVCSSQTLVVGSGISGLTIALLLARAGRRVVLIETQSTIGGYLRRFTRKGKYFDTGFHFTGGFDGALTQMLQALNLTDDIRETRLQAKVHLRETGRALTLPNSGLDDLSDYLAEIFPADAAAIRRYFQLERDIVAATPLFNLRDTSQLLAPLLSAHDTITLQEYFQHQQFSSPEVETILGLTSFCHGTPPIEIPLAQHCRISCGLNDRLSRVEHGGDAFLKGFKRELQRYDVKIHTNTQLQAMQRFSSQAHCQQAQLSNGETLAVDDIFFAVHPDAYLPMFPESMLTPSLRRRVARYEDTCSFFSIYGYLEDEVAVEQELLQFISKNNLNELLSATGTAYGTGMITTIEDDTRGVPRKMFTAFRNMHVQETAALYGNDSNDKTQKQQYIRHKQQITEEMIADIETAYPHYRGKLTILAAATPLTCRKYSPPRGSAYGVRIKIAESRLTGRLPIPNCYSLGHHAIMPGVLGCMMGAFWVFRQAVGKKVYENLIRQTLGD